jgi:glycosyltransferase involved in cell wall biosynthesis
LGRGGSESYLIAVAAELQRLGHVVTLHALEDGPGGERARELGLAVEMAEPVVAAAPDAILVQDAGRAFALAARFPDAAQVFIAHSELFDSQLPPQAPGPTAAVVALSERIERRLRVLGAPPPIVRLTQPVDTERFAARETIRSRPRRVLALSNYLHGERLGLLRRAWEPAVEVVVAGEEGRPTDAPELTIADADVVVGKGRALLEAMACGRAAYVFDMAGCDGWVTPEAYPALEADGFAGQATERAAGLEELRADLAGYRPEMGTANRDLVTANHGVRRHVEQLVELLAAVVESSRGARATASAEPDDADGPARLGELERLVRSQWRLEDRAAGLARENDRLHARILELERQGERLRGTRRYRLAGAVARPLDALRGLRR